MRRYFVPADPPAVVVVHSSAYEEKNDIPFVAIVGDNLDGLYSGRMRSLNKVSVPRAAAISCLVIRHMP